MIFVTPYSPGEILHEKTNTGAVAKKVGLDLKGHFFYSSTIQILVWESSVPVPPLTDEMAIL